jgi:hypothetical protein
MSDLATLTRPAPRAGHPLPQAGEGLKSPLPFLGEGGAHATGVGG